jgi:hypothetical protein
MHPKKSDTVVGSFIVENSDVSVYKRKERPGAYYFAYCPICGTEEGARIIGDDEAHTIRHVEGKVGVHIEQMHRKKKL